MLQRQLRWQLEVYPKTIPTIEAFFEFPSHSLENGHTGFFTPKRRLQNEILQLLDMRIKF